MTAHARSDFPPHWDPPPRLGYGESVPPLLDVLEIIAEQPQAPWVEGLYVEKLRQHLGNRFGFYGFQDVGRIVRLFQRLGDGPALTVEFRDRLERRLQHGTDIPERDREDLQALLDKNKY